VRQEQVRAALRRKGRASKFRAARLIEREQSASKLK